MDWATIVQRFAAEVDVLLVAGIIIVIVVVKGVTEDAKHFLADGIWRLIVLGAGLVCAALKADYRGGAWAAIRSLAGLGITYAGAATIVYQLGKPAIKALFGARPPADPTQGVPG
jgi:hypothetical protein